MNIKIIRLVTGAEIIGEILDNGNPYCITIKNPVFMRIDPNRSTDDTFAIAVQKFSTLSSQNTFDFKFSSVMTEPYDPSPGVCEQYLNVFKESPIIQVGGLIKG